MSESPLSRKKAILFSLTPTLLLLCLLIGAEIVLRYAAPSLDNPFVREITADGIEWYQINRRYLTKYFPTQQSVVPDLRASVFRKVKNHDTYRIVCLGSSSMFGTPYQMNANIAAIVRKQLRHRRPEKEVEVVNLGASAINSNVILDLFDHIKGYEPDLVLVYMGHNEFYGPEGVGASFLQRTFPFTIQWVYGLRELRLFKLIQRLFESHESDNGAKERNLMKLVSRNTAVPLSSNEAKRVFSLFESNLRRLIEECRDSHISIVASDLTSNLDFPPFASDTIGSVANWDLMCKKVRDQFQSGAYDSLLQTLQPLADRDSTNAFVNYWLGQTYRALHRPARARSFLLAAKDNDLLKFRAPERINTIIRSVCESKGVPFFSAESLFTALSPDGIAGQNLFWEHLHPIGEGYYHIANMFVTTIDKYGFIKALDPEKTSKPLLPWNTDSLSIPWLDLAYADVSMRNLTSNWPFNNYAVPSMVMQDADDELRQIALETYMSKLLWSEGCYKSAVYFQRKGQYRAAQTTYEALLEDYPFSYYAHYMLGVLLKETNDIGQALAHYHRSIELNPNYPYPRIDLGLLSINNGRLQEATQELQTALKLTEGKTMPLERSSIYYGLSAIAANNGNMQQALDFVNQSLRLNPGYLAALQLHAALLKSMKKH